MPRTPDASSFTRFQGINAQSVTTTKNPTQSSLPPLVKVAPSVVAPVTKTTEVAASAAPKSAVIALGAIKVNTKKRG